MLREIRFVQNIGRFETAKPTSGAAFGRCTLIFGENGWGKSTVADILRSLATNNSAIIAGRKTLAASGPAKVVMRLSDQNVVFENGAWTGPRPLIAVYDSAFINDNVFSGDIVSADHLKNQYGLVVGEEGVRLVRRLVKLDDENRDNNKAITAAENELKAVIRTVGLPAMSVDAFLALEAQPDIDVAIAGKDDEVQRVRRAKELKAAAEPSLLPAPTETAQLRELLAQSIEGVADQALARVRDHITAHQCEPGNGVPAHESWLEAGAAFGQARTCPYCGQPLTDRALVDAYKVFFSDAYKELGASIRKTRETFARCASGEFRKAVLATADQNAGHFRYWREAAKLTPPEIGNCEDIADRMEQAAARLDALFAEKQSNLTEALSGEGAEEVLATWNAGSEEVAAVNNKLSEFLGVIKSVKDSIDPAALPGLESELKLLQATKRRHESNVTALADKFANAQSRKQEIAKEKKAVRAALDEHDQTITADLGTTINDYLRRLAAGFRIDYRPPDYRGKEPSASYSIVIREIRVSPRTAEAGKPSFRNTLSAGDKSTLALALFLAKINADPSLAETIVVLDDPFTSLDHFRRQFTAIEIRKLCGRALQTIVLSHEKSFLRLLWDKIDHAALSSLALQTGAPGITTIAQYNIEEATQPREISERMKIEEFVEGEPHEPAYIRTRLRTVCEEFYRRGDQSLFREVSSLEEIIRILEQAPDTHPYKGALDDLRDINQYSRVDSHAPVRGNPAEDTSVEELKEFCRRVLDLTHGM